MRILITGGCGFIGSNLAAHFLRQGHQVTVFDNLERPGSEKNARWLAGLGHGGLRVLRGDVRDASAVAEAAQGTAVVFHLAAQVAVTTSVRDPVADFETNARGTLNVLEAARSVGAAVFFTSTNKVYGGMEDVPIVERSTRYDYASLPNGVPETQPLDFHSPYGCSKGAADQYVRDYARIYGLKTVVFRMSCIYGTRQFGNEDQGWVAHFIISALRGRPVVIYGDGKQVRDVLHIDDLVRAFHLALDNLDRACGQVYNIGGGPANTISVWAEFQPLLEELLGHRVPVSYGDWRPGDQRVYISDIRKAESHFGWRPEIGVREGITRLLAWVRECEDVP